MIAPTTNFNDHVMLLASESPRALVLDWWARLEQAQHSFCRLIGLAPLRNVSECEPSIAGDARLGPQVADLIRALRISRNRITHSGAPVDTEVAVAFANSVFQLLGLFARLDAGQSGVSGTA